MRSGWKLQLTKQAGEYLVAGELCRRGFLAATFSGNIRDYDILAISEDGSTFTVQVKTINRGGFQVSDAGRFLLLAPLTADGKQEVLGLVQLRDTSIWVFVHLPGSDKPIYYITTAKQVQALVDEEYRAHLGRNGGRRPRAPESTHCMISLARLEPFKDNWSPLTERLRADSTLGTPSL